MTPENQTKREPSLIDIEVLDLGPLYEPAVDHYISLSPERAAWPEEKRKRLVIRTECRWGRVQFDPQTCFVVNEKGEGPRDPLSSEVKAQVSLYAELLPEGAETGYFESRPFCCVPIDAAAAITFRALGIVALEDFIRSKVPEMELAYVEWLNVLRRSRSKTVCSREQVRCSGLSRG